MVCLVPLSQCTKRSTNTCSHLQLTIIPASNDSAAVTGPDQVQHQVIEQQQPGGFVYLALVEVKDLVFKYFVSISM